MTHLDMQIWPRFDFETCSPVHPYYNVDWFYLQGGVVTWRMRAPEKKPLVHQERPENMHVAVHRAEPKKNIEPIKALSEFHD